MSIRQAAATRTKTAIATTNLGGSALARGRGRRGRGMSTTMTERGRLIQFVVMYGATAARGHSGRVTGRGGGPGAIARRRRASSGSSAGDGHDRPRPMSNSVAAYAESVAWYDEQTATLRRWRHRSSVRGRVEAVTGAAAPPGRAASDGHATVTKTTRPRDGIDRRLRRLTRLAARRRRRWPSPHGRGRRGTALRLTRPRRLT
jgi:hypothetical protein